MKRIAWLIGVAGVLTLARVATKVLEPTAPGFEFSGQQFALVEQLRRLHIERRIAAVDRLIQQFVDSSAPVMSGRAALHVAPGVPPAVADLIRAVYDSQNSSLATRRTSDRTVVLPLPRDTTRALSRAPVEVIHKLPAQSDSTCVSIVQLQRESLTELALMSAVPLRGVCAYFTEFGLPGEHVRAWLDSLGYSVASVPAWDAPGDAQVAPLSAPQIDAIVAAEGALGTGDVRGLWYRRDAVHKGSRINAGTDGAACLMGSDSSCAVLLHGDRVDSPYSLNAARRVTLPMWVRSTLGGDVGARLGPGERRLLSDLVYEFGRQRFTDFWQSTASPDAAFEQAFGETMSGYLRRWLGRRYDARPGGPRPSLVSLAATLALCAGCLIFVARRTA